MSTRAPATGPAAGTASDECAVSDCPEPPTTYDAAADAEFCPDHECACGFDGCDTRFGAGEGAYDDGYCSRDCRYRQVAAGLLDDIKYDHRFCASCHRQIRDVYPPGRRMGSSAVFADSEDDPTATMNDIPDFAIGYAVPRPHTVRGLSEGLRPRDPTHGDWEFIPDDEEHQRMVCDCGAAHHQTIDRPLPKRELKEAAKQLSSTLDTLLREDKHSWHHDRDTLLDVVSERKSNPDDHTPDQRVLIDALAAALQSAKPYQTHDDRRDD